MNSSKFYELYFKRFFDVVISSISLIFFSPLILILLILVRINLGAPVLFKQQRPGKNEKIFIMYKLRTMNNKQDENGNLLPDNLRLTKFGEFLRSTSLDELPELWNILKGDMSLVGPRPLLVEYLELYTVEQKKRHFVRPGLTGFAQVMGRNSLNWHEKFQYDCYYVDNINFINDIKIIFLTFYKVLKRESITSVTGGIVEKFEGSNDE